MATFAGNRSRRVNMAGIYLHIPFCKQACYYCDFHFTTSLKYKKEMLDAIIAELALQRPYLSEPVESIYFGGGTPSVIGAEEIQRLLDSITSHFSVRESAEITIEANPDDLTAREVTNLKQTQINRFSIGIQSFFEEDLKWMNRAHNASQGESAIKRVQDAGFENITADLIYGFPLLSDSKWKDNITKLIEMNVPHVSAYAMTVEDRTALASFIKKGRQTPMNEVQTAEQFIILMDMLAEAGFEHYEISNFALNGAYSVHNSNYWRGVPYLGLGPSAHSFNGDTRQWNIANNTKYIESIQKGEVPSTTEQLSKEDRLNEYIMTALRTSWGMDLSKIEHEFGGEYLRIINSQLQPFRDKEWIVCQENRVKLTTTGKLYADHIASELFVVSN